MLYLKRHHHTQGHLGFLLCYLLRVLCVCVLYVDLWSIFGTSRWCSGKESTCQCRRLKRCGFDLWVGKISWRRKWQPTHSHLENPMHRGAWWATVPGVAKESDMIEHTHTWSILSLFWKSIVRFVSRSVFLHVGDHLMKKFYYSGSFVKNQLTIFTEFYCWALYSVPLIYLSVLLPLSHCPDCCSSIVSLEIVECQSSNFVLLLQYFVGYSGSSAFTFPYKLWNQFVGVHKTTWRDFDWDCIKSTDQVGKNCHPVNIESSYSWHGCSSSFIMFIAFSDWVMCVLLSRLLHKEMLYENAWSIEDIDTFKNLFWLFPLSYNLTIANHFIISMWVTKAVWVT